MIRSNKIHIDGTFVKSTVGVARQITACSHILQYFVTALCVISHKKKLGEQKRVELNLKEWILQLGSSGLGRNRILYNKIFFIVTKLSKLSELSTDNILVLDTLSMYSKFTFWLFTAVPKQAVIFCFLTSIALFATNPSTPIQSSTMFHRAEFQPPGFA
ncbi:hypothetical protein Halhy_2103 [Haliscomenobacter hydrossis DSM 1100]|uniref:Uncharacterized protein n=1 Tax=Haliscomenobacter hydrossis (strain ATCC 27775 / DSM 1100 / LMG 10767 / O) TaxID=760192 RepID=F4KQJ9_HALH1|nr:hypothetical protein Halhy_2103 [Haliscomenobacter hydrossis DSM 1100]